MNRLCSFSAQNPSRISHLTRTKLKVFTRTYKALPDLAPTTCLHLSHCSSTPTSLYSRQASAWGLHTMVSFAWNPLLSSLSYRITFSMRPHWLEVTQLPPNHVPLHILPSCKFFSQHILPLYIIQLFIKLIVYGLSPHPPCKDSKLCEGRTFFINISKYPEQCLTHRRDSISSWWVNK